MHASPPSSSASSMMPNSGSSSGAPARRAAWRCIHRPSLSVPPQPWHAPQPGGMRSGCHRTASRWYAARARAVPPEYPPLAERGMRSVLYASKGASRRSGSVSSNALTEASSWSSSAAAALAVAQEPGPAGALAGATGPRGARRYTVTARVPSSSEPSLETRPRRRAASCTAARSREDSRRSRRVRVGDARESFATRSANASSTARHSPPARPPRPSRSRLARAATLRRCARGVGARGRAVRDPRGCDDDSGRRREIAADEYDTA